MHGSGWRHPRLETHGDTAQPGTPDPPVPVLGVVDVLARVPAHRALPEARLGFRLFEIVLVVGLGEEVVLDPVGESADTDPEQTQAAGEVDAVSSVRAVSASSRVLSVGARSVLERV